MATGAVVYLNLQAQAQDWWYWQGLSQSDLQIAAQMDNACTSLDCCYRRRLAVDYFDIQAQGALGSDSLMDAAGWRPPALPGSDCYLSEYVEDIGIVTQAPCSRMILRHAEQAPLHACCSNESTHIGAQLAFQN